MQRRDHWDDYTPEEQAEIKAAFDVLAKIYPDDLGRAARKAFWDWTRTVVEMRARVFNAPRNDS